MTIIGKRDEWSEVVKAAQEQGWRVKRSKKGVMLYPPDKQHSPVSIHKTPSDHRAIKNAVAEMRRRGLHWPYRGEG